MKYAALVYQGGIANVFEVEDPTAAHDLTKWRRRLLQQDFNSCAMFARGLAAAGVEVSTRACNEAGNITLRSWATPVDEAPWREQFYLFPTD